MFVPKEKKWAFIPDIQLIEKTKWGFCSL